MNILFLIGTYPNFGGTEKVTTVLANYFSHKGHNISLCSIMQPHPEANELDKNVKFYPLRQPTKSKANIDGLRNIVIDDDIDIVINQFCLPYYTNQVCRQAIRGTKAKLVSVLHGVPDRCKKIIVTEDNIRDCNNLIKKTLLKAKLLGLDKIVRWSERYVYKRSDAYVVLSDGFVKSFIDYSGIRDFSKLLSIGNPITIPTPSDSSFIKNKKKQILYVGRMDIANKRINRILEIWKLLYRQKTDWNLCLVGGGPDLDKLKLMTQNMSLERVTFTGFLNEEPIQYYKESSILLLTSDLEGFGLVVVEGMSYGVVPVVYGSYVSIYDIVENNKQGIITPTPFSAQYTTECLLELMNNDDRRAKMSVESIKRSKMFSIENVYIQWENLFKELTK